MLDEAMVARLRCPVTLGPLTQADEELVARVNRLIEQDGLPTRGGQPHREPVQGGLVTEDRRHLYPIQNGIVCLLVERAIELEQVEALPPS